MHEDNGREALRPLALHHLHQLRTFAFADVIEQHEIDGFDEAVRQPGITSPVVRGAARAAHCHQREARFVGDAGGSGLAWGKVVEVRPEYSTVAVAATTARGGGSYEVSDPEYVGRAHRRTEDREAACGDAAAAGVAGDPAGIRSEVWRRDGGACAECGATEYLEFDHIIPWSRGGATSDQNLQLLCRRCNLAKGARI